MGWIIWEERCLCSGVPLVGNFGAGFFKKPGGKEGKADFTFNRFGGEIRFDTALLGKGLGPTQGMSFSFGGSCW
jgi:hypothetical protein